MCVGDLSGHFRTTSAWRRRASESSHTKADFCLSPSIDLTGNLCGATPSYKSHLLWAQTELHGATPSYNPTG